MRYSNKVLDAKITDRKKNSLSPHVKSTNAEVELHQKTTPKIAVTTILRTLQESKHIPCIFVAIIFLLVS